MLLVIGFTRLHSDTESCILGPESRILGSYELTSSFLIYFAVLLEGVNSAERVREFVKRFVLLISFVVQSHAIVTVGGFILFVASLKCVRDCVPYEASY